MIPLDVAGARGKPWEMFLSFDRVSWIEAMPYSSILSTSPLQVVFFNDGRAV